MTSAAVLASLRAIADAAREHRITLDPHDVIYIDNTPATLFQGLAVAVLHQWGWVTVTDDSYVTLTDRGRAELAEHCGPDFSDPGQWRAFEHHMFTVTDQDIP